MKLKVLKNIKNSRVSTKIAGTYIKGVKMFTVKYSFHSSERVRKLCNNPSKGLSLHSDFKLFQA